MSKGKAPPVWRSDEDRALEAMARRARERAQSQPRPDDEETDPQRPSLIARGGTVAEEQPEENTGITERIREDPDLMALFDKIERLKSRERDDYRKVVNEVMAMYGEGALAPRVHDIEVRTSKLESTAGIARWLIGLALAAALGAVGTIAGVLYNRGVTSGEIEIRLQHLERDLARVLQMRDPSGQPRPFVPTIKP